MTATAPAAPAKVYFTNLRTHARESQLDKLKRLIRRAGIEQIDFENKFVAIKIHFGELGNLSFLRPNYARAVAGSYAEPESVRSELAEARALMKRLGCFVVRTDGKAIEESAAEIIAHLEEIQEARARRAARRAQQQ